MDVSTRYSNGHDKHDCIVTQACGILHESVSGCQYQPIAKGMSRKVLVLLYIMNFGKQSRSYFENIQIISYGRMSL